MSTYVRIFNVEENCYRCEIKGYNLISPCGNDNCEARIHQECLDKQIEENNNLCLKCSKVVLVQKVKKLNIANYCDKILAIFISIILLISGPICPVIFIFGKMNMTNMEYTGLDMLWVYGFGFSLAPFFFTGIGYLFLFFYLLRDSPDQINNYPLNIVSKITSKHHWKCILIMFLLLIVKISIVGISHIIGILIFLSTKNYNDLFSLKTFTVGFLIIIAFIIFIKILYLLMSCSKRIYNSNLEEKTVFGSKVDKPNRYFYNSIETSSL